MQNFWFKNPALFFSISFLLGVYSSHHLTLGLGCVICLFWLPCLLEKQFQRLLLSLILYSAAILYSFSVVSYPTIPKEGVVGTAHFKIHSVARKDTSMGKRWNYTGEIFSFTSKTDTFNNIPVSINLPDREELIRPPANQSYQISGKLKQNPNGKYTLSPTSGKPWLTIQNTWSLAEWRYDLKSRVNQYIFNKILSDPTRSFLSGIATGDFENRLISYELSRFGLQHIMAISGFHFSIIAGILGFMLSMMFNRNVAFYTLMIVMSLYLLFLGSSPSILRAWVCSMIAFATIIFEKPASALNSLGVALILILLINPDYAWGIGFQFSFLVTASILLLYAPVDLFLQILIPKRKFSEAIEMNDLNQHGFIAVSLFRQGVALCFAVNVAALPLTLYYFQQFPVMSLLYNFFFPWMVSISVLLFMLGVFFDLFIPPVGRFIHLCNEYFTQFVLDYTYYMPKNIDIHLTTPIHYDVVVIWLGLLFTGAIWLREQALKEKGLLLPDVVI